MPTDARGIQAALAQLLVNDEDRRTLAQGGAEIQRRYGLSDAELETLRRLDAERLEITANLGRSKRVDFLRRGMPSTLAALGNANGSGILIEFLSRTFREEDGWDTNRVVDESRRFARFLDATAAASAVRAFVAELARFEWARLELSASPSAYQWAEYGERQAAAAGAQTSDGLAAPEGVRLVLGKHVRVLQTSYDVIAIADALGKGSAPPLDPTPGAVTLVRRTSRPFVAAYRTGQGAFEILRACVEPMPGSRLVDRLRERDDPEAMTWLRDALQRGILIVLRDDTAFVQDGSVPCESAR